jgi:hypothetical protein
MLCEANMYVMRQLPVSSHRRKEMYSRAAAGSSNEVSASCFDCSTAARSTELPFSSLLRGMRAESDPLDLSGRAKLMAVPLETDVIFVGVPPEKREVGRLVGMGGKGTELAGNEVKEESGAVFEQGL